MAAPGFPAGSGGGRRDVRPGRDRARPRHGRARRGGGSEVSPSGPSRSRPARRPSAVPVVYAARSWP